MALKKVINSATQQFEPVLVDKLVLDAVPTVNSFNSVTSDAVARAVAGASGEVPAVTESDNGKVLKAIYDEGGPAVEWSTVEAGTPVSTAEGVVSIGGTAPVSIHYVGEPESEIRVASLNYYGIVTDNHNDYWVLFDNSASGAITSLVSYTATLEIKKNLLSDYFPSNVYFGQAPQVQYISSMISPPSGGPAMTTDLVYSDHSVAPQTVSITGSNPAPAPDGTYIGIQLVLPNSDGIDLTDYLAAFTADVADGKVFDLKWPQLVPTGGTKATIPSGVQLVPPFGTSDSNKILTVRQTGATTAEAYWATAPKELPYYDSYADKNKYLKVSNYGYLEWVDLNTLPTFSSADAGKVLQVQNDGSLAWVTLS